MEDLYLSLGRGGKAPCCGDRGLVLGYSAGGQELRRGQEMLLDVFSFFSTTEDNIKLNKKKNEIIGQKNY